MAEPPGFHPEPGDPGSLFRTAVSVLHDSYLDSTLRGGFQYSQVVSVENEVFVNEYKTFSQEKKASGYSEEELEESYAFLLFENEDGATEVCRTGLRTNTSSMTTLGDPAKGVYISKYSDCLHPCPWYNGKSGYIVICKLIKGKIKAVPENYTSSYTNPTPSYDCHVAKNGSCVSLKTSHFQAFELSQYYVYECSSHGVAERPRQICPYIIVAFQYSEHLSMSALDPGTTIELENKVLYCPWRGQLSLQGQILCDIALRSPYSAVMPAQLPPKLEIKCVMGLSDLKKKLPEVAFRKSNYTENEVCYQGTYFSLFEVEISNTDYQKMDHLLETLKEKELVIIKHLHDQGFLFLLASSALTRDEAFDPDEPISLLALFLFTSSRSTYVTGQKQDLKLENKSSELSLKVSCILPGLRYAYLEATKCPLNAGSHAGLLIKHYFQEFAKLDKNTTTTSSKKNKLPPCLHISPDMPECLNSSDQWQKQVVSQLQTYLRDPSAYTLEMSAASDCLAGNPPPLCCDSPGICNADVSLVLSPDSVLPDIAAEIRVETEKPKPTAGLNPGSEDATANINPASNLKLQPNKRKSSRAMVTNTRKKWAPLKMLSVVDTNRNRQGTKKIKVNMTFPFPKKQGLTTYSNEPTLKLANLQFPHRRKRGAEVLSAEFVHRTQSEPTPKGTSSPDDAALTTQRPKKLKEMDAKKVPDTERVSKQVKTKKESFSLSPNKVPLKSQGTAGDTNEAYTENVGTQDINLSLKGSNYESHALNLLADLALGSCIPPIIPKDNSATLPPGTAKEQRRLHKKKPSRVASDHEYHRVDKQPKGGSSSSKTHNHKLSSPEKSELKKGFASSPKEKIPVISNKKNSTSPNSTKTQTLPSKEGIEMLEGSKYSTISSEHSYASSMSEHPKKQGHSKGAQGSSLSKNGAKNAKTGPLIGKVLPFRHQQNNTHMPKQFKDLVVKPRLKEDFFKSHTVNSCDGSVKVTCQWEAEYLFSLDSQYTKDSLEKTVIRALHGPWNPDLPDDVEDKKLILHMWIALFYSKPSKLLNSTRKVVEHSNPEKYVSLNSTLDPFELSEDGEDSLGLEKCPADSSSEAKRTPSCSQDPLELNKDPEGSLGLEKCPADSQGEAEQTSGTVPDTTSSPSGQWLSGDEPSTTSCVDECPDPSRLLLKDGPQDVTAGECVNSPGAFSKVDEEESERRELPDTLVSTGSCNNSTSEKRSNVSPRPKALGTDGSEEANQALNSSKVSQHDTSLAQNEFPEKLDNMQSVAKGEDPVLPEGSTAVEGLTLSAEDEDQGRVAADESLPVCEELRLQVSPECPDPDSPDREVSNSQDPLENQEEEEEEEDFEYQNIYLEPIVLALSESNDADLEHEDIDQDPVNLVLPKDIYIPDESDTPRTADLESPCDSGLNLTLSSDTSPIHLGPFSETAQSPEAHPGNQEAIALPAEVINSTHLEHDDQDTDAINLILPKQASEESNALSTVELESPCDSGLMLTLSSDASPLHQVPSDTITQSPEALSGNQEVPVLPAKKKNDNLENQGKDAGLINLVLPKEIWIPEESDTASMLDWESPCENGLSLTLSSDASPVHQELAAEMTPSPETHSQIQEVTGLPAKEIETSAPSDSVEDTSISQEDGGSDSSEHASLSIEESSQVQSNMLTQGEQRSSNEMAESLNKSAGAGQSQDLAWENTALEVDSIAEETWNKPENSGVCPVPETSLRHDDLDEMTPRTESGELKTSLCELQESTPTLLMKSDRSITKKHVGVKQTNFINHWPACSPGWCGVESFSSDRPSPPEPEHTSLSPSQPCCTPTGKAAALHCGFLDQSEQDPVLHKGLNSDRMDQGDIPEIRHSIPESQTASFAADDPSGPNDTEQAKPPTLLEQEIPVVKTVDLLEREEEDSSTGQPTPAETKVMTCVLSQQPSLSPSGEVDLHSSLLEQSKPDLLLHQNINPNPADQMDVAETCSIPESQASSLAADHSSVSCYAKETKKDTFLDLELPAAKITSLLEHGSKGLSPCEEFDQESSSPTASTASVSEEEEPTGQTREQSSAGETPDTQRDPVAGESEACADSDTAREKPSISFVRMPALHTQRDSGENSELSDAEEILGENLPSPSTELISKDIGAIAALEEVSREAFSGGSDHEYFGGTVHPKLKFSGSCSTKTMDAIKTTSMARTRYESPANKDCKAKDWDSLETDKRVLGVESEMWQHSWPARLGESDRHVPPFVNVGNDQGTLKDYTNFTVIKKHKDKTRTLQPSKRHEGSRERSDLISSLTRTWKAFDDLTQNTLDMECLRFHYKLKQIIKRQKSRYSTSCGIFPKEFPVQAAPETLPSREAHKSPVLNAPSRSRSPLLVTIVHSDTQPCSSGWHLRNGSPTDFDDPPPCVPRQDNFIGERNTAKIKSQSHDYAVPFHLSKLKYDNKLNESRGDISGILDEYAEINRVMLNSIYAGNKGRGLSTTSEETTCKRTKYSYFPRRTAVYDTMIADLCSTLHFRLKGVMKEACKNTFMFYLVETSDDPFFARMKNLLKKGGHTEIEPVNFCKLKHRETDRLIVIIRNEDISLHVHKIPSLLRLKHCPNVTFAGVDGTEDVTDHTYQDLFHMGGFVVSDEEVLETVTLGQLKEMVKALEKLNGTGRWRWLLHYKESKKLKEDVRMDSNAHKKNLILKSCQGVNIVEVLHYHQCDSKSSTKSEYLKCLLNLQVQHISARFAVYLTDKPSVSREVFESKGILVVDVNTFIGTVQKVAAPFKKSYW
ncbi:protein TASOR 2 isoform X3 [Alligator mississippiensis]|uniref:protein TASOR 2 isoform X3 n=1 Tax=Alligator mississippiensis TaxID=8496 RepID=UPI0028772715|nr:protein TASOR 2 isoform X3 [Alligator mississippiensis]